MKEGISEELRKLGYRAAIIDVMKYIHGNFETLKKLSAPELLTTITNNVFELGNSGEGK